jgi:CRP-like cAMP-binding protein
MQINELLDTIYPISNNSKKLLQTLILEIKVAKGSILFDQSKVEHKIYLIKKGSVRAYTNTLKDEVTFWFGFEGDTILSMNSYVNNQKSYETIETLEDCILYEISTIKLKHLFDTEIDIANWGRKLMENEVIKAENRLIALQCQTATERYLDLIKNHPYILKRVSLGYIASYLGITQVSLSRIRADIK